MAQQYESVDLVDRTIVERFAGAVVLAALTAALALISVPYPFSPAPISFQVIGVYLAALLLGPLWGGLSFVLYLSAGTLGAPVFSNGAAGLGYVLGPTGGFLVGFLVATVVVGAIVHRSVEPRSLSTVPITLQAGALFVGLAIIYLIGAPWLAVAQGWSLRTGFVSGAIVFVPGDVVKIAATLALVKSGELAELI